MYGIPVSLPTPLLLKEQLEPNCRQPIRIFMSYDVLRVIPENTPAPEALLKTAIEGIRRMLADKFDGWQSSVHLANLLSADSFTRKHKLKPGNNSYTRYICGSSLMRETSVLLMMESLSMVGYLRSMRDHYNLLSDHIDKEIMYMREYAATKLRAGD